jgi:NtrC-family two-component system response regulator AlgB
VLTLALREEGHSCVTVESGSAAMKRLASETFDVCFLDLRLGEENGIELLPKMVKLYPDLAVVVFTAYASVNTAVTAMRLGAFDYLEKPFKPDHLQKVLDQVERKRGTGAVGGVGAGVRALRNRKRPGSGKTEVDLTSEEPAMKKVYDVAFRAAGSNATILVLGESGTGKSVLARAVHERSPRSRQPFITISCPSLSRELLESELFGHVKGSFTGAVSDTQGKVAAAHGGTLFLDEIGELPLEIQPKLLRLLQEREYERLGEHRVREADVRIIAATNRDLAARVEEGHFREDLFYRLNVISLNLPPLRARRKDLTRFAENYLAGFAEQIDKNVEGFTEEAADAIANYSWPGNLRELRNAIERAVILCEEPRVTLPDLPEQLQEPEMPPPAERFAVGAEVSLEEIEREHIKRVIKETSSFEAAAKILGIDIATLYRKRKRMQL